MIPRLITAAILIPIGFIGAVLFCIVMLVLTFLFMFATAIVYGLAWPFAARSAAKPNAVVLPFSGKRRASR